MEKQASLFVKSVAKGAREKYNKAKRTYTCRTLKELIKAYRACTTSAEERALVKDESSHIRDLFREGDTTFRRRNIAKLLFFHMNGYPTDFGMKECIGLCGSDKFSDKRVAYLGIMILVDETKDILMLITNSLKRDLCHSDQHIVALALTVMANLASADISRDLLPEIEKHLESPNAYIRKKATLAAVRAVRKLPYDETPNVLVATPRLFETRQSAAHIPGTALVIALTRQHPSNVLQLRDSTAPVMMSILRDLVSTSPQGTRKHVAGIKSPFLQVKLLQSLRVACRGAPREFLDPVSDVLAQVASNTDTSRLMGTAVLYECVRTIVSLNVDSSLHALAVSTLGHFLSHKDPNVRYIALQELVKVVSSSSIYANIEEYRATIIDCLKEADPSIKHRTLELLHAIAVPENAVQISNEFVSFLGSTQNHDLLESATVKLCDLTSRFAPSAEWRCDTFLGALREVGVVMPEDYISSFVAWVSSEPSVWSYAARSAYTVGLTVSTTHGSLSSANAASLIDPFESMALAVVPAAENGQQSGSGSANAFGSKLSGDLMSESKSRNSRLERVCLYLFGEYGDRVVGTDTSTGCILAEEAISGVETVLKKNTVNVACFSASALTIDPDESMVAQEMSLVRDAAMAALVKLAARLGGNALESSALWGGSTGNRNSSEGPSPLLALTSGADSDAPVATVESGLGTDLLNSLGIHDDALVVSKPSGASGSLVDSLAIADSTSEQDQSLLLGDGDSSVQPLVHRVRRILDNYVTSADLETQQRALEYSNILRGELASVQSVALARMPPMNYATIHERLAKESSKYSSEKTDDVHVPTPFSENLLSLLEDDDVELPRPQHLAIAGSTDLLALPSTEGSASSTAPAGMGSSALDDLLRDGNDVQSGAVASASVIHSADHTVPDIRDSSGLGVFSAQKPTDGMNGDGAASATQGLLGTTSILSTSSLAVSANFFKEDSSDAGCSRAEFTFRNLTTQALSGFVFQLAVPKYMQTTMKPASSSSIDVGEVANQTVLLRNSLHGTRPVQLRYRVQYALENGEEVREQGAVAPSDLPAGL